LGDELVDAHALGRDPDLAHPASASNGTYGRDTIPPLARSVRPGGPDVAPELHGVLKLDAGEACLHSEEVELALLELACAVESGAHHLGGVLEPCAVELDELGRHGTSFLGSAAL